MLCVRTWFVQGVAKLIFLELCTRVCASWSPLCLDKMGMLCGDVALMSHVSLWFQVYAWGCNDEGALGRKSNDSDEFLPGLVDGLEHSKIVQVSAGDSHTAALTSTGEVYVWGVFRVSPMCNTYTASKVRSICLFGCMYVVYTLCILATYQCVACQNA